VYLRGRILPWSVTNWRSRLVFLKSSASTVKSIFGFGRGVRISTTDPREPRAPRRSGFSGRVLRGMELFYFAMNGVTAKGGIIFFDLELLGLELFITRGGITGRGFAFLSRLGAFNGDNFAGHSLFFLFGLFVRFFLFGLDFGDADCVDRA
jgi:hypothetical protein